MNKSISVCLLPCIILLMYAYMHILRCIDIVAVYNLEGATASLLCILSVHGDIYLDT